MSAVSTDEGKVTNHMTSRREKPGNGAVQDVLEQGPLL